MAGPTQNGSGRTRMRLDPFALPARFTVLTEGPSPSEPASIYLDQRMAIVRRRLGGIPLTLSLPVTAFRGVAVRLVCENGSVAATVCLELIHNDPDLSVPLLVADDFDDVIADWKAWSRTLGLPLLLVSEEGMISAPVRRLGKLEVGMALVRRFGRPTRTRRPRFLQRRRIGSTGMMPVWSEDREIIART